MARSKEDKAQFIADLSAAAAALHDSGVEIPSTLLSHYSPKNCLWILVQRPNATNCAGFHAWRSAGRCVKKGAKGIAIMVPIGGGDDDDKPRFTWRYVFDVTDTIALAADSPSLLRDLVSA